MKRITKSLIGFLVLFIVASAAQAQEQNSFKAGGGKLKAPAQRLGDFVANKTSATLPDCSYLPGITSADLKQVLPDFIYNALREGFKTFGQKLRGYLTNEAVVVATESRTSSPIRIPRLSYDYNFDHIKIVNERMLKGGVRLAGILNEIFG